ncbi:MAG TPA: hypothetical protein VGM69_02500 [Chloroflexota bacterium]
MTERHSRFSDVCGTIDELKRLLHEETDARPEVLDGLVGDALVMEARMEQRLGEYERFREQILAIADDLRALGASRRPEALAEAPRLRAALARWGDLAEERRAETVARAERVRAVAQDLENKLYRYKALALELERAYRAVKGGRSWVLDEAEAEGTALPGEPEWARWLPASPSRERILRYLRVGRAHLLPSVSPERPPMVQFEDGGVMPLPAVRWSEEIRNFYPADAPAHARGLLYRPERIEV